MHQSEPSLLRYHELKAAKTRNILLYICRLSISGGWRLGRGCYVVRVGLCGL